MLYCSELHGISKVVVGLRLRHRECDRTWTVRPDSQLCEHDDIFLPNTYLKFPAEYEAGELKGGTSAHRARDYVQVTFVENSERYGALAYALVSGPASPQAPLTHVQSQDWHLIPFDLFRNSHPPGTYQ